MDTFGKVKPPVRHGQAVYDQDYAIGSSIKAFADERRLAALLLHHQRKMGADDVFDTVSGSLGLTGAIDQLMILQRPGTQDEGSLHGTGRDIDEFEWAMHWDRKTARWSILGDAALHHLTRKQQAIIEVLKQQHAPMKPSEVAPLAGMDAGNCKQMMWQMAQKEKLVRNNDGTYSLPEGGSSAV